MSKPEGSLTYDKALQYIAPIAWIVLGLLGWSLDAQISDFKSKINSVEESVGQLAIQHAGVIASVAEIKIRSEDARDRLNDLSTRERERSNQIERMSVVVGEILDARRDERKARGGAQLPLGQ